MWTEADKSKQEQMKINKQTNKNTQLQNKIKFKKKTNRIFPLSHTHDKTKKNIFLFFTQPKTYHLSHFIYILDNFSLMSFNTANLKVTLPQDKQ